MTHFQSGDIFRGGLREYRRISVHDTLSNYGIVSVGKLLLKTKFLPLSELPTTSPPHCATVVCIHCIHNSLQRIDDYEAV